MDEDNSEDCLVLAPVVIFLFPLGVFIVCMNNSSIIKVSSILNEIGTSLNDYPIADFSYSDDCGEKYAGNLFTFPGSQFGCSCINVDKYKYKQTGENQINPGKCDDNQTLNNCVNVPEISQQKIYFWGDGKFCSKKYNTEEFKFKGYLHYLQNSVLENKECEKGYKKCGKLDDMGNYLCIKEDEDDQCPMNDIQVTLSEDEELEKLNYSHIMVNNKYYYFTNTSEKPIISKLKVVEEGKKCIYKKYYYTSYPQWILDNNFKYYGCRYGINGVFFEKDIQILDYKTKKQIYNDSDFDFNSTFYNYDYDYPIYSLEANMTLYSQRYIGYNKKCLIENNVFDIDKSPFNEKIINETNALINEISSNNDSIYGSSLASFIILLIASCYLHANKIWKLCIWTLISCLSYIFMAIPIYNNISKFKNIIEFPICGDDIINAKINYYHSTQGKIKITTILSIIFINMQLLYNILVIELKFKIVRYLYKKMETVRLIDKAPQIHDNHETYVTPGCPS